MIETQHFAGASKTNTSFLTPFERRLAARVLPRIPSWLETYHLTMLTLVWSSLILLFSYWAAQDLRWLWGVSVMIALQYVTDHYDGKVGMSRHRPRPLGLLHGSPARLLFPVFGDHRLRVHPAGTIAFPDPDHARRSLPGTKSPLFWRLRRRIGSRSVT